MKIHKSGKPRVDMPDLPALPPNWSVFVEVLQQRRYTSGDVNACIEISRKVLMDWVRAGIVSQLFHGLGSGKGEERFGKWRLFSIMDIWTLALYRRLRDEGIYIERLRGLKRKARRSQVFQGEEVAWWFYQALGSWVHRQPFWLATNMRGTLGHTPIKWQTPATYFVRIGVMESDTSDLFLTVNLLPLMDKAMRLSGPLEFSEDKSKGILLLRLEGQALRLEGLPKSDTQWA